MANDEVRRPGISPGKLARLFQGTHDNPIERFWEDFHAQVTRNHQCPTIDHLVTESNDYLTFRNDELNESEREHVA